ncbi:hypothetical protein A2715_00065 [Candidatus Woesebacteria bacterium RIFCSPHIGHO2_01_FULL_39_32]|uniref:Gfo/Idh/MocA-like oxidoreductase N-terminal domain-containing protein n=1 Tax=Candidatus Woesebacteria bacterium RIFCSPLOWO2_01_FULL_39_25 TaxID=1802521 RepID=A0A1F8BQN8_9BACT|nr:MAG: putative dehydrogenase [Parcubacteria group bacterium GW2011_GWA1_38_7]OGM03420.1 MAG: hypothetical protein A2124_01720 [Candidatus Woesebacteria bacterium GWB1_37_5]OGM24960.1 MAG: hypothetical protein A2715_00065 [Candidatus Woesebacteria bacterium RIFCSPHIGHO2_01_FULL_39_32]OGM35481.1 MAG: hypothetical protein A3F01_02355 [Candidatus Woesebacteria bacterium RIFCSPHIGHO2_12_FULL_38_11]OGM65588.1 MAG: hypothetical protein A2893_01525 [Candidatus Woesebacteria bacterium RIFCSPLOWO2_01_F
MNKKLKAAVIGLGLQNLSDHIPTLLRRRDVDIVAVCDPDLKALERFKEKYPSLSKNVGYHTDYRQLSKVNIDFAIVAVPHFLYPEIVEFLASREIYLMKEKPLARNLAEADELFQIPGFTKYCFICTQRRFNPLYQFAKEKLDTLGIPFSFNAVYKLNIANPEEGWRGDLVKSGGGCILDMGYHIIDQLMWWFGMPDKLFSTKSSLATEDVKNYSEDTATIAFKYENGLHGTVVLSRAAGEKLEHYSVHCSRGHISGNKKSLIIRNKTGEIIERQQLEDDDKMLDDQLDFFIKRVHSKAGFIDVVKRNFENMKFIEKCYGGQKRNSKQIFTTPLYI